jgi:hypothetical protein
MAMAQAVAPHEQIRGEPVGDRWNQVKVDARVRAWSGRNLRPLRDEVEELLMFGPALAIVSGLAADGGVHAQLVRTAPLGRRDEVARIERSVALRLARQND